MTKIYIDASFRNCERGGRSELYFDSRHNMLRPQTRTKSCKLISKNLIMDHIYNIQCGNITISKPNYSLGINIPDNFYTYAQLIELLKNQLKNKNLLSFEKTDPISDIFACNYKVKNEQVDSVTISGSPLTLYILGMIGYMQTADNNISQFKIKGKSENTFYMNLYKSLNLCNVYFSNQFLYQVNFSQKMLFDNWCGTTSNIKLPSDTLHLIGDLDELNASFIIRNIFGTGIQARFSQIKCTFSFQIE